jgi:hypothetical protein
MMFSSKFHQFPKVSVVKLGTTAKSALIKIALVASLNPAGPSTTK